MTVGTAVSSLMALCGKSAADTNLPTGMLQGARDAVNAACEEARIIAPSLFGQRKRFSLAAPATVSFTLLGDLITFLGYSSSAPGIGSTLLLDGATNHNTIATYGNVQVDTVTVSGGAFIDAVSPNGVYPWDGGALVNGEQRYVRTDGLFAMVSDGAGWNCRAIPDTTNFWYNSVVGSDPSSSGLGFYQASGGGSTGGPLTVDIELDADTTGGTLDRAAEGAGGARTATLWNDCWASTSATVRILADVLANGRPIQCLRGPEELARMATGFESFTQGYPIVPTTYDLGTNSTAVVPNQFPENAGNGYRTPYQGDAIFACWLDDFAPVGLRLRFAPMPGTSTLIELVTVAFPDVTSDADELRIPNGLDTLIFIPLAQSHWMRSSWFKPEARQADAITRAYSAAIRRLTNYGPAAGFLGRG